MLTEGVMGASSESRAITGAVLNYVCVQEVDGKRFHVVNFADGFSH
jgi:hypothetical protein